MDHKSAVRGMSRSRSVPRGFPSTAYRSTKALLPEDSPVSASASAAATPQAQTSVTKRHQSVPPVLAVSGSAGRSEGDPPPLLGGERPVSESQNAVDSTTACEGKPPSSPTSPSEESAAGGAKKGKSNSHPLASSKGAAVAAGRRDPPAPSSEGAAVAAKVVDSPMEGAASWAGIADLPVEGTPEAALTEGLQFSVETLSLPGLPASHLRHVLTNGRYLVAKTAAAALLVWRLEEAGDTPTVQAMQNILLSHPRVECIALQDNCGHMLVTCSQNILLWDLREPSKASVTLGEDFSGVSCCHLSAGGEAAVAGGAAVLALGVSQSVWLLDTVRVRHLATLRGHECAVTSVTMQGALCAAGSESGQVKVWEVPSLTPLYSSHVVAPRPACAVTIEPLSGLVAAGCGSQVSVMAAAAAGRWAEVASVELERPAPEGRSCSPRPECAVLSLQLLRRQSSALFGPHNLLLAATTGGLTVLNTRTWLPVFTAPNTDGEPWGGSSVALTPGGAAVVCGRSALQGRVSALWLVVRPLTEEHGDAVDRLGRLSIVCRHPLPAKSVLRARPPRTAPGRPTLPPSSRVRSSGYGTAPRRTMFQPRTNTGRSRPSKAVSSRLSLSSLPTAGQRPAKSRDRPPDRPTLHYQCHVTPPPTASRPLRILRPGDTLLRIALSGSGRHLACTSRQGHSLEVARIHQLDVTQDQFLLGTQGAIASVAWSLSGNRLAAVSAAGVQLWSFPGGELCGRRPPGSAPFTAAQFFFTDEFLLASRGDTVELCRLPDEGATAAAAHSGSGSRGSVLRPVLQCRLPCREVLHVAGASQLRSTLAVACCSDYSVRLLDVQAGRVALTLPAAHPRPPHIARLCEGSPRLPAALPLYDLVGSAAVGDGVRLWDVRCGRLAVRLPAGDLRALPAGFQVSPCGRLVALGSDAAHVWLWDLRSVRGPLAWLRAAAAGVSDVAFHPRRPGLVAALLDGRVQTWPLDGGGAR